MPAAICTGANVKSCRPATYRAVIDDLAADKPAEHIIRARRISGHTVAAIARNERGKIAERKKDLATMFSNICEKSIKRADKTVKTASYAQAMVGAGIAAQRMLELRGENKPDVGLTINLLNMTSGS